MNISPKIHSPVTVTDTSSVNLTLSKQEISAEVLPNGVDHDALLNFVANEHIDWTNASNDFKTSGDLTLDNGTTTSPKLFIEANQSGSAEKTYLQVTSLGNLEIHAWTAINFITEKLANTINVQFFNQDTTDRYGDVIFKIWGSGTGSNSFIQVTHSGDAGDGKIQTGEGKLIFESTDSTGGIDFIPKSRAAVALHITGGEQVGIGTTTPATSAKLDINSTTGALLVPRMTTTQRNALTATNGMIIYNTTTNAFNFYENGAWVTK